MGIFMSPSQMKKLMTAAKLQKTLQLWKKWLSFTDYSFVFLQKKPCLLFLTLFYQEFQHIV